MRIIDCKHLNKKRTVLTVKWDLWQRANFNRIFLTKNNLSSIKFFHSKYIAIRNSQVPIQIVVSLDLVDAIIAVSNSLLFPLFRLFICANKNTQFRRRYIKTLIVVKISMFHENVINKFHLNSSKHYKFKLIKFKINTNNIFFIKANQLAHILSGLCIWIDNQIFKNKQKS